MARQPLDFAIQSKRRETNWLVTMTRPEGLLLLVFIALQREFRGYENAFQQTEAAPVRVKQ